MLPDIAIRKEISVDDRPYPVIEAGAIYPTDNVEPQPAFDCQDLAGNGCVGFWLAIPEN